MKHILAILSIFWATSITALADEKEKANKLLLQRFLAAFNGTWELQSRIINGRKLDTKGCIMINLSEERDRLIGSELIIETGKLEARVSPSGNNKPYVVASHFPLIILPGNNSFTFSMQGRER